MSAVPRAFLFSQAVRSTVESLEAHLERARDLDVREIADAVEAIGFECTRCGGCCTAEDDSAGGTRDADVTGDADGMRETDENIDSGGETDVDSFRYPHTATVFPDEIRRLQATDDLGWREVARPMPYGFADGDHGWSESDPGADPATEPDVETFEWALAVDGCGDCTFYTEEGGIGACTVHGNRPFVCRTYPFSIGVLSGERDGESAASSPEGMGAVVRREGPVLAHECEGLGREISAKDAEAMAGTLKRRAIREIEEAIAVRDNYRPTDASGIVVHDSEGQKRADGTPLGGDDRSSTRDSEYRDR